MTKMTKAELQAKIAEDRAAKKAALLAPVTPEQTPEQLAALLSPEQMEQARIENEKAIAANSSKRPPKADKGKSKPVKPVVHKAASVTPAPNTAPATKPVQEKPATKPETAAEKLARLEKELADERKQRASAERKAEYAAQERDKLARAMTGEGKSITVKDIPQFEDVCSLAMDTVEQRGRKVLPFKYAVLFQLDSRVFIMDASGDVFDIPVENINENSLTIRDKKGVNFDYFIRKANWKKVAEVTPADTAAKKAAK